MQNIEEQKTHLCHIVCTIFWRNLLDKRSTMAAVQERVKITAIQWAFRASYGFSLASPMNSWSSRGIRTHEIIIYDTQWQRKSCASADRWMTNERRWKHCGCWMLGCKDKLVIFSNSISTHVSNMKYRGRTASVLILACGWVSKRLACERNINRFHYKLSAHYV